MKKIIFIICMICCLSIPSYAQACLSQPQIRQLIASGQIISIGALQRQLFQKHLGKIQSVRLCPANSSYIYHLTTIKKNGQIMRLQANARNGSLL